ncbi:hypothetical protein [Nonomuraea dietziae]|uniref:hypothetical protein n=1 Tax=Nonomuraea dietziae TaxID=65515 RepID=UPI0031E410EA
MDSPEGALFFTRGSLTCVINCGPDPVPLPPYDHLIMSSADHRRFPAPAPPPGCSVEGDDPLGVIGS